jgi:glycosyltransferase involved in cell wall biosynthesis
MLPDRRGSNAVSAGLKILFFTRYGRLGASSRLRALQFIPCLEEAGIDCIVQEFFTDDMLSGFYRTRRRSFFALIGAIVRRVMWLTRVGRFDLVWIEKELFPFLPAWGEWWLSWRGVRFVTDYDDAIFHNYDKHPIALVRVLLGRKIAEVMRRSETVVVGNDYLAAYATAAGARRICYLPTVVDTAKYWPASKHGSQIGEYRVGWIGTPATTKYVFMLAEVFRMLARWRPCRLVLIGAEAVTIDSVAIEVRSWAEATEVDDIQTVHVGIMPLPDSHWERGKCGYKLIQYMACGIPVVASPVGANVDIVSASGAGFLARNADEWYMAFRKLDPGASLHAEMAGKARRFVEAEFSLHTAAPRFVDVLRQAAHRMEDSDGPVAPVEIETISRG